MTANYPAFDFPPYGLGTGWDGPRWLDFFEGKLGEPAWAVWLMHAWNRHGPPTPWVLVGTMPAERYARLMVPPSKDLARELAHKALFTLLNRITPALPEPDRGLYWSRAMVMTDRAADDYGAWERVTWRVDGVPVPARTRTWAGVRVGFTTVPGVSIVVLDARPAAAEVGLEQVSDGTAYHFRADAPLNYPVTWKQPHGPRWVTPPIPNRRAGCCTRTRCDCSARRGRSSATESRGHRLPLSLTAACPVNGCRCASAGRVEMDGAARE